MNEKGSQNSESVTDALLREFGHQQPQKSQIKTGGSLQNKESSIFDSLSGVDGGDVPKVINKYSKVDLQKIEVQTQKDVLLLNSATHHLLKKLNKAQAQVNKILQEETKNQINIEYLLNQEEKHYTWQIIKTMGFVVLTAGSWWLFQPLLDQMSGAVGGFQTAYEKVGEDGQHFDATSVLHELLLGSGDIVDTAEEKRNKPSKIDAIING